MPEPIVPSEIGYALQRMAQHACRLLIDACVIAEHQVDREQGGRGEYILRLVALEVLMKGGALSRERELKPFGHSFNRLFEVQTRGLREWVSEEFGARRLDSFFETGRTLDAQLSVLTSNYATARYVYERSMPYDAAERLERERAFLSGDLPEAEWDLIYYHGLVTLLTEGMLARLAEWLPPWFEPANFHFFPPHPAVLTARD